MAKSKKNNKAVTGIKKAAKKAAKKAGKNASADPIHNILPKPNIPKPPKK